MFPTYNCNAVVVNVCLLVQFLLCNFVSPLASYLKTSLAEQTGETAGSVPSSVCSRCALDLKIVVSLTVHSEQEGQRNYNLLHTTRVEAGFVDGVGEHYKKMLESARHERVNTRTTHL